MTGYYRPIEIGGIRLKGNLFAAPMAGYTDRITRAIALENGADLAFTEMVSAEALVRNSERTRLMMRRADGEDVLAVQLFGSEPKVLGAASRIAREFGADLLDLNAGCPVSKVTTKGAGAALVRTAQALGLAVEAMTGAGLPVTVKIRSGWDDEEINWVEAANIAVEAGAAAIGFHPRTRKQGYGGKADWTFLRALSRQIPVPVIGSGDLDTPNSVKKMFEETGCTAVMIARGAIGNPGIYMRTRDLLTNGIQQRPDTPEERRNMAVNHLTAAAAEFGNERASREMKKHLAAYVRGWPSASELRRDLMAAVDIPTLLTLLKEGNQSPRPPSR